MNTTTPATQIVIWEPYESNPDRFITYEFSPAIPAADAVAYAMAQTGLGTDAHVMVWDGAGNHFRGRAWEIMPESGRNAYLYTFERGRWRKVVPHPVTPAEAFRMVQTGIAIGPDEWWRVAYDTTDFAVLLEGKPAPSTNQ
jgi:hypothetical protein